MSSSSSSESSQSSSLGYSSSESSIGTTEEILKFEFTSDPYLQVTSKNSNITVSNIVTSTGATIETNITTGTYFPNEPYIEETGGWTAISQATAKDFRFDITPANGYAVTITNISYRAYATSAGPSAFSFDIDNGGATYTVNAPDSALVTINQSVSGVRKKTSAVRVKIQGWLNGSRTSTGTGTYRIDDIVVTGTVKAV